MTGPSRGEGPAPVQRSWRALLASALVLGTHPSLGARSPVLGLMERGPECLMEIAAFALEAHTVIAVAGSVYGTLRLWDLRRGCCNRHVGGPTCTRSVIASSLGK